MTKKLLVTIAVIGSLGPGLCQETVFTFRSELGPGWSWVREHPQFWRIGDHGLEVRIEPADPIDPYRWEKAAWTVRLGDRRSYIAASMSEDEATERLVRDLTPV